MKKRAFLALLLAAVMTVSCPFSAVAEANDEKPLKEIYANGLKEYVEEEKTETYAEYLKTYSSKTSGKDEIKGILPDEFAVSQKKEHKGKTALYWDESIAEFNWSFSVQTAGFYSVKVEYCYDGTNSSREPAQRGLMLDGKQPFSEAAVIDFRHMFCNEELGVFNSLGDEVRPSFYELYEWQTVALSDSGGLYTSEFEFYLEKGTHRITLTYLKEAFLVGGLSVYPVRENKTYSEYSKNYSEKKNNFEYNKLFQAETAMVYKNDSTITFGSDGNPSTIPAGVTNKRMNTIGGYGWRKGNQEAVWSFTVPQDGWYQLGVRRYQAWGDGLASYRQIKIDGEVPFKEWECYKFDYSNDWELEMFSDEEENAQYVFLKKGEHTLSMTVNFSSVAELIRSIYSDTQLLSEIVQNITKLTGSEPDANYDYKFFENIPELETKLSELRNSLKWKVEKLSGENKNFSSMSGNFENIISQLETMLNDPYRIAANYSDLTDAQSNLGTYYQSLQEAPLMIDYIRISNAGASWNDHKEAGFFRKIWATIKNFIYSFTKDYDNVGSLVGSDVKIKDTIRVWIARGTEWAEIIKELTDYGFTEKTGIQVNINVVPSSQLAAGGTNALMLSIAAGNAPDAVLGIDSNSPVEFAIRDAAVDLSSLSDYEKTAESFLSEIIVPYKYREGVYAIPETMNYNVMFYRKDILNSLQLEIPETWEELYNHTLPTLYQNGCEFYYPAPTQASYAGFSAFLYQSGSEVYSPDGLTSALGNVKAVSAFKQYCELFTNYGIPISANFFNRFRTGIMPMGISDHNMYILLSVSAPELAGKWDIAPIPGTRNEKGETDRSNGGLSGTCCMIFTQSEKQESAWEYLKWWMSNDVQVDFAEELESLIGIEARWNTANIHAFADLPWERQQLETIMSQWDWVKEAPMVLGGYFTARYINNAWNTAVVSGGNYRDAIEEAVEEIDKEMKIKQEEYS